MKADPNLMKGDLVAGEKMKQKRQRAEWSKREEKRRLEEEK